MTNLIVDMNSVQDMMSALDLISARVAHLSTTERDVSALILEEAAYHADLPRASTSDFADELWDKAKGTQAMTALLAVVTISEVDYVFSFNDIIEFLDLPVQVVQDRMRQLERLEKQLRARLLGSHWCDHDGRNYYTMHPAVRNRLSTLLTESGIED